MHKKILLFSRDPGGTNTIIPLVEPLIEKGYNIRLFGKDLALDKYTEARLSSLNIMEFIDNIEIEDIENFLEKEKPDFIITGTSGSDFTEKYIWKAAEILTIPAFAILDQWINYGIRFSEYTLSEISGYNNHKTHPYLPAKILLMDEYAKEEAIKDGLAPSRLMVTGNPYFETLLKKSELISHDKIKDIRNNLGISPSDFIITYASEPLTTDYKDEIYALNYWGFTEKTIFKKILESLYQISYNIDKKIKIIIKLHPREVMDNYTDIISENNIIPVIIDKDSESYHLIMASDMVCGMSSMFLIESVVLNKPVISVLIGLKRENPFILDRRGILKSILDEHSLIRELNLIIEKNKLLDYNLELCKDPVDKIISEMEKYLWEN